MRETGTIIRTLDMSDVTGDRVPFYGYALAERDGTRWVICTEGVGWEVSPDRALIVDTFGGWWEMPFAEVIERAARGRDVDLADHVRTFGSRLEVNFFQWHNRLNG